MSEKLLPVRHISVTLNKRNMDVDGQMSFAYADQVLEKYIGLGYVISSSHVVRDLGDAILFMHILALPSALVTQEVTAVKRGRKPATEEPENVE